MQKQKTDTEIIRQLSLGNAVVSVTIGDSMEPLLYERNTQVVIIPARRELKTGDLPLYIRPTGQMVMHRVIKVDTDFYYTRGDNRYGLEKVPKKWIYGLVTEIYRKGKTIHTTDRRYRFYVKAWSLCYPVRYLIYLCRAGLRRL